MSSSCRSNVLVLTSDYLIQNRHPLHMPCLWKEIKSFDTFNFIPAPQRTRPSTALYQLANVSRLCVDIATHIDHSRWAKFQELMQKIVITTLAGWVNDEQ